MLTDEILKQKARDDCLKSLEKSFTGEFLIDLLEGESEWCSDELRQIYNQPMVVWRGLDDFEIFLSNQGSPIGFVDHDKWHDCGWEEIADGEIIYLAEQTGFIAKGFSVKRSNRGENDCIEALITSDLPNLPASDLIVKINPARRAVIAIIPVEKDDR